MIDEMMEKRLLVAALDARGRAYAPYSNFLVGAALLTADGQIIAGCNVENGSYGLCICAERTAICSAVASGQRDFTAIAVASDGGVSPCGACRQFLVEFNPGMLVLMTDLAGNFRKCLASDLLPGYFKLQS